MIWIWIQIVLDADAVTSSKAKVDDDIDSGYRCVCEGVLACMYMCLSVCLVSSSARLQKGTATC